MWKDIERIREQQPLLLNITNYVVMNTSANALLAIGASPVMAHAIEEVDELVGIARALVVNIGTLSTPWIAAMVQAGQSARRLGIPVVLDPVGCGATRFRTETARMLMDVLRPAVIRGNASEIRALVGTAGGTKGVDSIHTPDETVADAQALAQAAECVVSVSGPVDLVVDGERMARIDNGHPMMARVTGMGCTASALTGAFLAVNPSPFAAAHHAMTLMGCAGEIAAETAPGPGSFQVNFLDALYGLDEASLSRRQRVRFPGADE